MSFVPFWTNKSVNWSPNSTTSLTKKLSLVRPTREDALANGFTAQSLSLEQIGEFVAEWSDLTTRSLEPNAFLEPGFALSAARHFPPNARPDFLVVWKEAPVGFSRRMMALCPIMLPGSLFADGLARAWMHKQAATATPLVDCENAQFALGAFLDWFERHLPGVSGVVFPGLAQEGPTYAALAAAARRTGRRTESLGLFERAVLRHGESADDAFKRAGNGKTLPELRRRRRRLEELGRLEHRLISTPAEVRRATEEFLTLEASGWKRNRGALLLAPSLSTFVRSATRLLAQEGKCQIHRLSLDGRPIAMGIVLESGGRSYFWKIAYDEEFRSQAPGIELAYEVTKAQSDRADIALTDSCAIANHPMINKIWPDREVICDLLVQTRAERPRTFNAAYRTESARREIRALAKRAAIGLLKRRSS
jgi:CelD/BcsL family acetyltransferase involved in cellulose biosynthesis